MQFHMKGSRLNVEPPPNYKLSLSLASRHGRSCLSIPLPLLLTCRERKSAPVRVVSSHSDSPHWRRFRSTETCAIPNYRGNFNSIKTSKILLKGVLRSFLLHRGILYKCHGKTLNVTFWFTSRENGAFT